MWAQLAQIHQPALLDLFAHAGAVCRLGARGSGHARAVSRTSGVSTRCPRDNHAPIPQQRAKSCGEEPLRPDESCLSGALLAPMAEFPGTNSPPLANSAPIFVGGVLTTPESARFTPPKICLSILVQISKCQLRPGASSWAICGSTYVIKNEFSVAANQHLRLSRIASWFACVM